MSDLHIFVVGCFVSLIVASAVGLLLWGAANEPSGDTLPTKEIRRPKSPSQPVEPKPLVGLEAKSSA